MELPERGECSLKVLQRHFAHHAPDLLIDSLRDAKFAHETWSVGTVRSAYQNDINITHARKVVPEDAHVDWQTWPAERVLRTQRAMGHVWSLVSEPGAVEAVRVQWHELTDMSYMVGQTHRQSVPSRPSGPQMVIFNGVTDAEEHTTNPEATLGIRTCDGRLLSPKAVTIEGRKKRADVARALSKLLLTPSDHMRPKV